MPSGRSSQDEHDFCGQCRHHRRYHEANLCTVCPAFTTDNRHAFVLADGESGQHKAHIIQVKPT